MKGRLWLSIILWLAAIQVVRSQQNFETAPQTANAAPLRGGVVNLVGDAQGSETNALVGKHVQAGGPLVQPLKSRRLRDVPKRLWHWVNPLAPAEPKPVYDRASGLSTRAWSTTVGWTPGRSAFPNEVTHESTLGLVSFTRTP